MTFDSLPKTTFQKLLEDSRVLKAKALILDALFEYQETFTGPKISKRGSSVSYKKVISEFWVRLRVHVPPPP